MYLRLALQFWRVIVVAFLIIVLLLFLVFFSSTDEKKENDGYISKNVWRFEPIVQEIAKEEKLDDAQIPILLSIMMQESGGTAADVMQSSESAGLSPGAIIDPVASIHQGIIHWKQMRELASKLGITDLPTIIQSYNFGPGWLYYVKEQGSIGREELRKNFAKVHTGNTSCGWRSPYCYGDYTYSDKVMNYYSSTHWKETVTTQFQIILTEARTYDGWPYVWGGNSPSTSFDCSGLMEWIYAKVGVHLPRTAEEQYYFSKRVDEKDLIPGDLVFFTGTSDHAFISHVGLYVGNQRMYNSNGSGVGYSDLTDPVWKNKIYGYGRVLVGGR